LGIKAGLSQGHHHHHPICVGKGWPLQAADAGLKGGNGGAAIKPINTIKAHPIAHHHLFALVSKARATGAKQYLLAG
jgi:hypothetical protein